MINKRTQLRRLTALLDVAKAINPREFDMMCWWRTNCNTAGCLAGHYIHCKKPKGFKLVPDRRFTTYPGEMFFRIRFDGKSGSEFDLLGEHFGLDETQAHNLFNPTTYTKELGAKAKGEAIGRIKQIIKEATT